MKRIINLLLLLTLVNISIYANTTKEDVDDYLEVSRGGAVIKHLYRIEYKRGFPFIYGITIEKADKKLIEKYKSFIFDPKYQNDFNKILGKLDDNSYTEIMAFYHTKLGKKYAKAFQDFYADDTAENLLILIKEEKKPLLNTRRKLITKINKVLNYNQLYRDVKKTSGIMLYHKEIKENKLYAMKKINQVMEDNTEYLKEYVAVSSEIIYRDFSDDELSQLLVYAKAYGYIEMKYVYKALEEYIKHFYKDVYILIEARKKAESDLMNKE